MKFIFILLISILVVFLYFSYTFISQDQFFYIKTLFRESKVYSHGHYIFPEKIFKILKPKFYQKFLIYSNKYFLNKKIIDINLEMPKISLINQKVQKIVYSILLNYSISVKQQIILINSNSSIKKFIDKFEQEIIRKDKNQILNLLIKSLKNNKVINLNELFSQVENNLLKEIKIDYKNILSIKKITHFLTNTINIDLYFKQWQLIYNLSDEIIKNKIRIKKNEDIITKNINRLEKYGQLLKKYPQLLKFLYIEKLSNNSNMKNIQNNFKFLDMKKIIKKNKKINNLK